MVSRDVVRYRCYLSLHEKIVSMVNYYDSNQGEEPKLTNSVIFGASVAGDCAENELVCHRESPVINESLKRES